MSFTQLIEQQGSSLYALIPLFICSILVIAVILERIWAFSRTGRVPKELMRRVETLISTGNRFEAIDLLEEYASPYARIARASLTRQNATEQDVEDMLTLACDAELAAAARPLPLLGTIGNIAPFIGLFGTVIGIMEAFQAIGKNQAAGYGVVAPSIAAALIATGVGLAVGIVSVIANNWFTAWIEQYRLDLERFSTDWAYRLKNLQSATTQEVSEPVA